MLDTTGPRVRRSARWLAAISRNPDATLKQIAAAEGVTPTCVSQWRKAAEAEGLWRAGCNWRRRGALAWRAAKKGDA